MGQLVDSKLEDLLESSRKITEYFFGNQFCLCSIINGKSGECSEDCMYCAQSVHNDCQVESYGLLDADVILSIANKNCNHGIERFSIVTSGRKASQCELEEVNRTYMKLDDQVGIKLCASHGLLEYKDFLTLKRSGVSRYHNNLESSKRYFNTVCSTHTYEEKIKTIKEAQQAGLEVCSGGILGMGESMEDRIDLAFELRNLGVMSIPINLLNPMKGTPLENITRISEEEFYRTCAIFRFINPQAVLRLAGGRGLLSDKGERAFKYCVNGMITGELLTTTGNDTSDDLRMIEALGYKINR